MNEFSKFNKIKSFTNDVDVIAKCFKGCEEVIVNEDLKKVKRKNPVPSLDVLNERTIMVSGFSTNKMMDKEKVEVFFSKFGKVLSVWNHKSKNKKKKCMRVEFDSSEAANKAASAGKETFKDEEKEYALEIKLKKDFNEDEDNGKKKNNNRNNENKKKV